MNCMKTSLRIARSPEFRSGILKPDIVVASVLMNHLAEPRSTFMVPFSLTLAPTTMSRLRSSISSSSLGMSWLG